MNQDAIKSRLTEVQRAKNELIEEVLRQDTLLNKLKKEDSSWVSFLNRIKKRNYYSVDEIDKRRYMKFKEEKCDFDFINRIKSKLDKIPDSNGSRFYSGINLNISIISDTFLYNSFKGIAKLNYVTPDNYMEHLEGSDILIVASTWKGLNNEWRGIATPQSKKRDKLYEIINIYRENQIPVVFYNKEDPVNFDRFIEIAQKCDHIFTTAIEKIPEYKNFCGHSNVNLIEFGANPLYHNPIGMNMFGEKEGVLFAGSWYYKYPNRQKNTQVIFDGVIESNNNIKILDRNFHLNLMEYSFPERYLEYISPAVSHEDLQKLHKLYNWSINLSSVDNSSSMIPNRVFELQALGSNIISNYSPAINNRFQNVFIVTNRFEVGAILNNYTEDEIYGFQLEGIRNAMSKETSYHRLEYLCKMTGLDYELPNRSVLVLTSNSNNKNVVESFNKQTYKNKTLMSISDFNDEIKQEFDMITFFSEGINYNHYYLMDLVNGFVYTDSDFISKNTTKENSFNYINEIPDKHRTLFWTDSFTYEELLNNNFVSHNGFLVDHYEYSTISDFKKEINVKSEYRLSVIVPVYNNGPYLKDKCFRSLQRSSIFEDMEIILVDDGSSCEETKLILNRLYNEYSNVKLYTFTDNGSGSASRPRNKGIELATTKYVTYLDPDNEAINDGYAQLLDEMEKDNSLDLIVGNIVKAAKNVVTVKYYNYAYKYRNTEVIDNPQEMLKETSLRAQSIQALIVKKELIESNNLKMVENAVGQDTLFYQQLIMSSNKIKISNLSIHIYYAEVTDSVTNTISKRFFQKYLIMEKARQEYLLENDLMEIYMEQRFNFYFINWYFKRVPLIEVKDLKDSLDILYEIYALYIPYINNQTEEISLFRDYIENGQYKKFQKYCLGILK